MRIKKERLALTAIFLTTLAVLGIALQGWLSTLLQPDWEVNIWCDPGPYKQGDPIQIRMNWKVNTDLQSDGIVRSYLRRIPYIGRQIEARNLGWAYNFLEVRNPDGSACAPGKATFRRGSFLGGIKPGKYSQYEFLLNDCALLGKAGTYSVQAGVVLKNTTTFENEYLRSEPMEVVIEERTEDEMAEYIEQLAARLSKKTISAEESIAKNHGLSYRYPSSRLKPLIYTRDNRIIPILLDQIYEKRDSGSLVMNAFNRYLPIESETKHVLLEAARERGMPSEVFTYLHRFGCTADEFSRLADEFLDSNDPNRLSEGLFL
ncbi:MAG: hypothetical protein ACYS8Z_23505, partial [Planctomycetota bacterium]